MKILLTGATGYIGKRLLPILVGQGHEIICSVRDKNRFYTPKELLKSITVIEVDLLKKETLINTLNPQAERTKVCGFYL